MNNYSPSTFNSYHLPIYTSPQQEYQNNILHVSNFPRDLTKIYFEHMFSPYGRINDITVFSSFKIPTPYTFIEFDDPLDAVAAKNGINNTVVSGMKIRVQYKKFKLLQKTMIQQHNREKGGNYISSQVSHTYHNQQYNKPQFTDPRSAYIPERIQCKPQNRQVLQKNWINPANNTNNNYYQKVISSNNTQNKNLNQQVGTSKMENIDKKTEVSQIQVKKQQIQSINIVKIEDTKSNISISLGEDRLPKVNYYEKDSNSEKKRVKYRKQYSSSQSSSSSDSSSSKKKLKIDNSRSRAKESRHMIDWTKKSPKKQSRYKNSYQRPRRSRNIEQQTNINQLKNQLSQLIRVVDKLNTRVSQLETMVISLQNKVNK